MILVKNKEAHPISITKVIKGDIREKKDMTTGAIIGKGDGEILYDISEDRGRQ